MGAEEIDDEGQQGEENTRGGGRKGMRIGFQHWVAISFLPSLRSVVFLCLLPLQLYGDMWADEASQRPALPHHVPIVDSPRGLLTHTHLLVLNEDEFTRSPPPKLRFSMRGILLPALPL
jgi:hypothetical protein